MEQTLAILKPDCVRRGLIGEVIRRIEAAGFRIRAMKMVHLTKKEAEASTRCTGAGRSSTN